MLSSLRQFWNSARAQSARLQTRRKARSPVRRQRPGLESLEDRAVPTVAFTPNFAGTTQVAGPNSTIQQDDAASLQSPPVVLIFTGNYWQTNQGQQDQQTLTNDVQSILNGPYLSRLAQYGSDGKATFGGSWQDSTAPALTGGSTPSGNDLLTFVQNEIKSHPNLIPPTAGGQQAPLFVIVNDPQDSAPGPGVWGYNDTDGITHSAYVGATSGANGQLNVDGFTQVFSHELAESMAPAVHVTDPGNQNAGYQIADNEPENGPGYSYRLNGVLVQAYWSQQDNAFVVPDGNLQTFTLNPIWSNNGFTGQSSLYVTGGQLNSNGDQVTIDRTTDPSQPGGVLVNLNGEVAQFAAGTTPTINVLTTGPINSVQVNALPAGDTLNVNSWGQLYDLVTVGNGSLSGISGTVNVSNSSGQTTLNIEAYNDPAQQVSVTNNQVAFSQGPTINYQAAVQNADGSVTGVTGVNVAPGDTASSGASNTLVINSVPPLTNVSVWMSLFDVLEGPAAGNVTVNTYNA
jgi:hypothetical protein